MNIIVNHHLVDVSIPVVLSFGLRIVPVDYYCGIYGFGVGDATANGFFIILIPMCFLAIGRLTVVFIEWGGLFN